MKSLLKKIIPEIVFSWYHLLLVWLGAVIYNFPSKKLIVIGVTGTNGKSTVVHLITEILEKAGFKTACLSSIKFKIDKKEWPNMLKMTMPGRFKLQRFLSQAVRTGCKYAILEVTSEGIKQHRHKFIDFDGAVFTNLTKEHIEAHKGFENYKKAKGKLFKALAKSKKKDSPPTFKLWQKLWGVANFKKVGGKFVVINVDDKYGEYYAKLAGDVKKYPYTLKDLERIKLQTNLIGKFNKYNALAAIGVGLSLGISLRKTLGILKSIKGIPGRMELVINKPFKVFVDYAHTPDSLKKVYKALGKGLICVFGSCGGGRDKWKRPELGRIAAEYCDKIILTNEDPFDENPESILRDIESGFSKSQIPSTKSQKILDRREAINKTLSMAKKDDIVIITGKGSEPWICVEKGRKIPWSDRDVVLEEFNKIYG